MDDQSDDRFAYVAIHYDGGASLLNAMVFGLSLEESHPRHDKVLLFVKGTDRQQLDILTPFLSRVIEVEDLEVNPAVFAGDLTARFHGVFNKLWTFTLTEYSKVLVLDTDTIVNRNMDEVFDAPTPASFICDPSFAWKTGDLVPAATMRPRLGKALAYLNIGALLLTPSEEEFRDICRELNESTPRHFYFPEQDYLSERYLGKWHSLSGLFNFNVKFYSRPQGMGYGRPPMSIPVEEIGLFHFLGDPKPHDLLFHRDELRRRRKPLTHAQKGLLSLLESGSPLPVLEDSQDSVSRYHAVFERWFTFWRRAKERLSAEQREYVSAIVTSTSIGTPPKGDTETKRASSPRPQSEASSPSKPSRDEQTTRRRIGGALPRRRP